MAYLKMPETLKKDKPAQAGQGLTQSATGGKVTSVAPETAFMRPTGTIGQPAPQSSGASRFVNFDKILAANIPGATSMAQDVLTKAAQQGQQAEQLTKEASKTFKTDVEKGTQKFSPSKPPAERTVTMQKPSENETPEQAYMREQLRAAEEARAKKRTAAQRDTAIAEAQKGASAGYAGPKGDEFTSSEAYRKAQQATAAAQQTRESLGTQAGLEALLNQLYGTAGGTGGSRLDAALARVAGGPSYEAARKRFANLDNILLNAATQAQQQAQSGEAASMIAQQQYKDLLDYLESLKKVELPGLPGNQLVVESPYKAAAIQREAEKQYPEDDRLRYEDPRYQL